MAPASRIRIWLRFVAERLRSDRLLLSLLLLFAALLPISGGEVARLEGLWKDVDALALLAGMLFVSAAFEASGFFDYVASRLLLWLGDRPRLLLASLLVVAGLSASLAMNDSSIFVFVPLFSTIARSLEVDEGGAVTYATIAANVGSALTPIGNPQNIIIWRWYRLSFATFTSAMVPFTLLGLALLVVMTLFLLRPRRGVVDVAPRALAARRLALLAAASLVLLVAAAEAGASLYALPFVAIVLVAAEPGILRLVDWLLLVSFALLVVDFHEVSVLLSGRLGCLGLSPFTGFLASVALSQVVSNVPTTILLIGRVPDWKVLAVGVNLGGVGLVTGSLANLIAVRIANITVREMHEKQLPYFLAMLALMLSLIVLRAYP